MTKSIAGSLARADELPSLCSPIVAAPAVVHSLRHKCDDDKSDVVRRHGWRVVNLRPPMSVCPAGRKKDKVPLQILVN